MINKKFALPISHLFILLFVFCCCTNRQNTSILSNNLCPVTLDSTTLKTILEKQFNSFNGYIYILNSECSECIGTFISFIKDIDESELQDSVLVIIPPATRPIINHYIKKCNYSQKIKIILLEYDKKTHGINPTEERNGIVIRLKENKINAIYQYFP